MDKFTSEIESIVRDTVNKYFEDNKAAYDQFMKTASVKASEIAINVAAKSIRDEFMRDCERDRYYHSFSVIVRRHKLVKGKLIDVGGTFTSKVYLTNTDGSILVYDNGENAPSRYDTEDWDFGFHWIRPDTDREVITKIGNDYVAVPKVVPTNRPSEDFFSLVGEQNHAAAHNKGAAATGKETLL